MNITDNETYRNRTFSDIDGKLRKVIRLEKWKRSGTRHLQNDADNNASSGGPIRDVCFLWRFGGHGNLFEYDEHHKQPGQVCISLRFPRWKQVARGIYEYKSELGKVNCTDKKKWWMKLHEGSPDPMCHRRHPAPGHKRIRPPPIRIGGPILARVRLDNVTNQPHEVVPFAALHAWLKLLEDNSIPV